MNDPNGWQEFCAWYRNKSKEDPNYSLPVPLNTGKLNRFAARFRLGRSYRGLNLEGYPESSVTAYSSVLGVFFAYSALEQLYVAVGQPGDTILDVWAIYDPNLSAHLRKSSKILSFLQTQVNDKLAERIEKFTAYRDDNLLVLAAAVRQLVAHGIMTIHSGGVTPETVQNFCHILTSSVYLKSEECFKKYVMAKCQIE